MGEVVWCNYEFAWGGRYNHFYKEQFLNGCAIIESDLQPIRFQGQFCDVETGLHYNRFRYYDSDVGMFIQRDPIGLLGGLNTFQYAPNPIGWVDPWGLNAKPETAAQWEERFSKINPAEKYNKAKGKLTKIAKRNNWIKDNKLTKINDRDVYFNGKDKYYYFDTQHGRFEVSDLQGKHLGEVDIDGNPTKPADNSGKHDIKCK
ncbi:RHS repeat-associated core domain-containing protein [Moraxella cuniculi DSM 21768]|uniref:RHS repeat-associated core domain-containing protein n=1 Tax=Moraxella cuniculi DSM 21768 TaxID=1122245 RepID=A0A1N7G0Y2_9GAMM|nr:RHS repeat-associated core domain-containing protein [Moraxella cuniculi]OOS07798.1 hypothetical protein B0189_01955 [Moraxella cuniculi]SIS06218.1 RHS repeat-associated core domain-containing protein [Moraxella cuniculi DSM 21768]